MTFILEILKFTIPGVIVFLTAYFLIKAFMENEQKKREMELKGKTLSVTSPIKIQAYERLVLFLERINPESLLIRVQTPEMQVHQLHNELLIMIRAEFEHNLSQQIYVSPQTWSAIKQTKEHVIKIINTAASEVNLAAPASELSENILRKMMSLEINPIYITIGILKQEAGDFI